MQPSHCESINALDPYTYKLVLALKEALEAGQKISADKLSQASHRLCEHVFEHYTLPAAECERVSLAPWQERRAKALLAQDSYTRLSIAEVAEQCSLSRSHFSRAFKKATGLSPQAWALRARVQRAKALLNDEDLPIARISLDCGFSDQSHFCRTFSKIVGVSPKNWRRLHKNHSPVSIRVLP